MGGGRGGRKGEGKGGRVRGGGICYIKQTPLQIDDTGS